MNPAQVRTIEITEYQVKSFPNYEISEILAIQLYQKYSQQVEIEFPNYKTANKWQLKAKGWVGYIPLSHEFGLRINPKVPIKNLFGMLEYAYEIKSFRFLEGLMESEDLEEFYNNLAYILAQKILERCGKGLYRTYLSKTEQLAYVRGRLNLQQAIQKPWDTKLKCSYEETTTDISENHILMWTLFIIGSSGLCSERISPTVRKAYQVLQRFVTLKQCSQQDCIEQQYNRLNEDYRILHNLCRFFLENTAPNHETGNRMTLPFLVDMAKLYELFVAEWLKMHLPKNFYLKFQESVKIGKNLLFKIDLVLYDSLTLAPRYILDTKYKTSTTPSTEDVAQVIAYAVSKGCQEVILVYPSYLTHHLNETIGNIRVRSLTFSLEDNINQAGNTFLENLFFSESTLIIEK
ncbi:MAG: McrC family protein [Scytonematopsis contorta HA4267-MV1]|jgi:5-methylcytosine-specific restriction enzyme subunit McrC|nr:McrC family protein [Scytonematopsis contorta HA4267-MV1]